MGHSKGSWLQTGNWIGSGDYLVSSSELCHAVMQGDGNFCVYRGYGPENPQGLLWHANNGGWGGGQFFAVMQGDGNFVVYEGGGSSDGRGVVWDNWKHKGGKDEWDGGKYFFQLEDSGRILVYRGSDPSNVVNEYYEIYGGDRYKKMAKDVVNIVYDTVYTKILKSEDIILGSKQGIVAGSPINSYVYGGSFLSLSNERKWSDLLGLFAEDDRTYYKSTVPDLNPIGPGTCLKSVVIFYFNDRNSRGKTGLDFAVKKSPVNAAVAEVMVSKARISVPYRVICTLTCDSGYEYRTRVLGTYEADTYYNPRFNLYDANNKLIETVTLSPDEVNFHYSIE